MMKKKSLIVFTITSLIVIALLINNKNASSTEIDKLRQQHIAFLNNSPFKETLKLSKKERKEKGIPPNKYYEEMWSLTMDPATGRPHPERLYVLQENLNNQLNKVPGEITTPWTERGPDNVGGRTRAIMFDPNDATNQRVFAGGVSGGLWVNDDITDVNSAWVEVGIPQNLAISCIAYDPNNINVFYVGTGESYVNGTFSGNGLWKSNDAGVTWSHVFGGTTGNSTFEANTILTVNTPDSIAGDYVAVLSSNFGGDLSSALTGDLVLALDGAASGDTTDACDALTNGGALSGNIAVIRRGSCSFVSKVIKAQNEGATGVIIVNNISSFPFDMGGSDGNITIPSIMVSREDGEAIIAELGSGVNVTMALSGSPYNGVVVIPGVHHINDIAIKDIGGGNSEIYVAAADASYTDSSPWGLHGGVDMGLYKKSTADGGTWDKLTLNTGRGDPYMPNDIEIATDGKVWVSTTNSRTFANGGGRILSSSDGTTFTLRHSIAGAARTQIAVSGSNAGTVYVLAELGDTPTLIKTTDEFGAVTNMAQPNDADTGISATDFTRGQSFYNLMLEVDPTNDNNLFVGGIDIFRSTDAGTNWSQISKWSNNNQLANLNVSLVHADQHAAVFGNNDPTKMLFSNDGGVYYSSNSGGTISGRKTNYNTLQFYKGAIGSDPSNEKLLAGAQDNANQLINNASAGIGSSFDIHNGGDGAYVFIDKDNEYMISSFIYNTYRYHDYANGNFVYSIAGDQTTGDFINPSGLDSDNNILYTNGTTATPAYQIYRYTLGTNSASQTTLTNALLTRAPSAFKPSRFTTTTLFVGTVDGKLLKLENANATPTWTDISGTDFVGSVSCIELGATEDNIMVTFHNYGIDTNVMYSDDGGVTWQNKEGDLPDVPTKAVIMNPLNNNEVIVGTDLGVWASPNFNDPSPNWYQVQNGMKDVPVTSFDLRTADNVVLASTYGRGMFTGQFTNAASGLSVDEFAEKDLIKIYPTVSNGEITIASIREVREGNVAVFDINGRKVHSTKVNFDSGLEQPISLRLSSGVYIVKFATEGLQSSHKIIIE